MPDNESTFKYNITQFLQKFKFSDKRSFLPVSERICDDPDIIQSSSPCPITPYCRKRRSQGTWVRTKEILPGWRGPSQVICWTNPRRLTSDDRPVTILRPRAGDENRGSRKESPFVEFKGLRNFSIPPTAGSDKWKIPKVARDS